MAGPLTGRTAIVTGGTRGIGRAIALRLRAEDANVTVTGRGETKAPEGCALRAVDFADRRTSELFADEIGQRAIDVLVNNAGINAISPFERIDPADFDRIQDVNLRVPFLLARAVVPGMRRRGWGRVVNVASIFSVIGKAERGAYSASKFALDGLTAALAAEVAGDNVLVNTVSPGFIETDLTRRVLGERGMAEMAAQVPMRRLGQPEEIAALVAWLVGPQNTYLSGQNVVIDGGFSRV